MANLGRRQPFKPIINKEPLAAAPPPPTAILPPDLLMDKAA